MLAAEGSTTEKKSSCLQLPGSLNLTQRRCYLLCVYKWRTRGSAGRTPQQLPTLAELSFICKLDHCLLQEFKVALQMGKSSLKSFHKGLSSKYSVLPSSIWDFRLKLVLLINPGKKKGIKRQFILPPGATVLYCTVQRFCHALQKKYK